MSVRRNLECLKSLIAISKMRVWLFLSLRFFEFGHLICFNFDFTNFSLLESIYKFYLCLVSD